MSEIPFGRTDDLEQSDGKDGEGGSSSLGEVDWTTPPELGGKAVPEEFAQVAFLDGEAGDGPAKGARQPAAKGADRPQEKPEQPARAADAPRETTEHDVLASVPRQALDAVKRAMDALALVEEGKPMPPDLRAKFEQAIKDAAAIDPRWAKEQERKLTEEVQTKQRKLPDGRILPTWTPENEKQLWDKLLAVDKALSEISEPTRSKVMQLDMQIKSLAARDALERGRLEQQLLNEARSDSSGKVGAYLIRRNSLDRFTRENAAGILRRNIHQQDLGVLHSKTLCQGLYAMALDRTGKQEERKRIEDNLKASTADSFVMTNLPEIARLKEKYGIKEVDPLDEKVPGRAALKRAMDIMRDDAQGTLKQRLEKAEPFFQQAIGATDDINIEEISRELAKIGKEAAELGEDGDPQRLAELDQRGTELLEKIRQPGLARLAYAFALNNTAVESKDDSLNERAINVLKSITKVDEGFLLDPLVQGALKIASEKPPRKITEEEARAVGKVEVERIKKELAARGEELNPPWWRKVTSLAGDLAIGFGAWYALSYVFRPVGSAMQNMRRHWELGSRLNRVEVETNPGMKAGEEPKLFYKDKKTGQEHPVDGVNQEDGKIRIRKGEQTEIVKLRRGDKLILKVPPDTTLTPEQVRDHAAKKLTPTTVDQAVDGVRRAYDAEMEALKRTLQDLQQRLRDGGLAPEGAHPADPNAQLKENAARRGWRMVAELNEGKDGLFYRPQNAANASGEARSLSGDFNLDRPDGYRELLFEGKPDGVRYFQDSKDGKIFRYSEVDLGSAGKLKMMTPAPELELISKTEAQTRFAPREGETVIPRELAQARPGMGQVLSVEVLEMNPETGRLEKKRISPAGEIPKIGELNKENIAKFVEGWLNELDREIEKLKGDPAKAKELAELQRCREQLDVVRADLASGETAKINRVVDHFRDSLKPEAEIARVPEGMRSWRGRVAVGGGIVIGIGILVGAGLAYYNRFHAKEEHKPQRHGPLPRLGN